MKKNSIFVSILSVVIILTALLFTASCTGCNGKSAPEATVPEASASVDPVSPAHDYDGVVQDFTPGVAHIQALHRQTMYSLNGGDCDWRNSRVTLNDDITAETLQDGLHIVSVTDVFQLFVPQPVVQLISTDVKAGTILPWPINDLWIEDASLNDAEIKVTAEQALERLKQWNGLLPGGNVIALRLPVGPLKCNAQWVVGGVFNPLFIDAVTGEVTDWCPAFPRK